VTGDKYRTLTAAAVLLVAAIAAVISFVHIEHLAVTRGQTFLAALLLPISIDGTVAAASLVMLRAARTGLGTPWLARVMLGLSVAATLAANVAYGARFGPAGALLSGWPAVAFIGSAEMAIGMVRKHAKPAPGAKPESAVAPVTVSPVKPVAEATVKTTARTPRTRQRGASRPDTRERKARAILTRQPEISGAELGRAIGASPRTGQRLLASMNGHSPR
jgi:hypothetical protein